LLRCLNKLFVARAKTGKTAICGLADALKFL
jgi:hypothetical protein